MTIDAPTLPLHAVSRNDVAVVGGKNASLGEMIQNLRESGVRVPPGFATTVSAYRRFLRENGLDNVIQEALAGWQAQSLSLAETGLHIRTALLEAAWPASVAEGIRRAYRELCTEAGDPDAAVAVRSSATAAARTRCWRPAGAVMPRCSPIAPSATARPTASTRCASACR